MIAGDGKVTSRTGRTGEVREEENQVIVVWKRARKGEKLINGMDA